MREQDRPKYQPNDPLFYFKKVGASVACKRIPCEFVCWSGKQRAVIKMADRTGEVIMTKVDIESLERRREDPYQYTE